MASLDLKPPKNLENLFKHVLFFLKALNLNKKIENWIEAFLVSLRI